MIVACGMLTVNDALMKSLVANLPLGQVLFIRAIVALVVVLALLPIVGGTRKLRVHRKRDVGLCALLMVINVFLFPMSLPYMDLADAIILAYTSPLWVVALVPVLIHERVGLPQWAAVLIGFAGAALVIKPAGGEIHWAIIFPLTVALIVALRDILTRHIASRESALTIVICANILTILVSGMTLPFGWKQPDMVQLVQILGAGTLFSISMVLMVEAFRWAETTVLSTFKYSSILFAAILGFVFWGEWLDIYAIIGTVLIVVSGIMVVKYRPNKARIVASKS